MPACWRWRSTSPASLPAKLRPLLAAWPSDRDAIPPAPKRLPAWDHLDAALAAGRTGGEAGRGAVGAGARARLDLQLSRRAASPRAEPLLAIWSLRDDVTSPSIHL